MKAYRMAAVLVSAVLLAALLVLMVSIDSPSNVPATTTTATVAPPPDSRNDGRVSEAERVAGAFGARITLDVLNQVAQVACAAAVVDPDKAAVRRSVLAKAQQIRPGASPQTVSVLTDRVAALACARAFAALPPG